MAGEYINPAVDDTDGDPSAIEDAMVTHLQARIAGLGGAGRHPERYILEAVAIEQSETRDAANGRGQTFEKIARWLGEKAFELAPLDPIAATAPRPSPPSTTPGTRSRRGWRSPSPAWPVSGSASRSSMTS
jgi:hypothetical protein